LFSNSTALCSKQKTDIGQSWAPAVLLATSILAVLRVYAKYFVAIDGRGGVMAVLCVSCNKADLWMVVSARVFHCGND
jgi:hypothetical protein